MKTRLKTKLTLRFAAILSVTTLGLGIYTFVQSQKDIDELLDRSIIGTTAHIDGQIAGPLKNAENSSRMIAEVTKPTIEVDRATSVNSTTFPKLSSYLTELIRINPDLSSTSVVLDRTGESIRSARQKDGSIVVTTSILIEDGRTVRRILAPSGSRFRELSSSVGNLIDQRILPIYQQVKETRELAWSGIRVLHPADGIEVPGITCAAPIIGPGGEFIGTAMVDLTVGDISRYLQTLQVSQNGYAFLAETSRNGARLAAHPDPHRLLTSSGGAQRIVSLAEMDDPLLTLIVDLIETEAAEISQGRTVQRHLLLDREDWRIGIQKISGPRTPPWTICIVIPESDFAAPLKETLGVFITALGGALLFGIGAIFWLSQMMTRSISRLVRDTQNMTELNFQASPPIESSVLEISELSESLERMKTSLRSFQKLVPAEYAKWLMRTGQEAKIGGERRHVTVCFADLVGFTRLSERVSPEKLGEILAEYFDVLSEEVTKTGGTVDKFNGDDVMSFWGAPVPVDNPALKACLSALESERTLDRLYPEFEERGIPKLSVSFGVSTGDVIVGNVGSSQRMNYTVIGDAVNLASRLEGLNRMYGTRILVGDTTLAEAGPSLVTRQVDWVAVHGKRQATGVHEVIEEKDRCSAETIKMAKIHTQAMQAYKARDWDEAERLLNQVLEIKPGDKPAELVLVRINELRENPPDEDWDGILQMTWK